VGENSAEVTIIEKIKKNSKTIKKYFTFATAMSDGVTGNTSDSESEESRFDP